MEADDIGVTHFTKPQTCLGPKSKASLNCATSMAGQQAS